MTELILLGVIAALYVLGSYQGGALADMLEGTLDDEYELAPTAKWFLTWAWPIATIRAMIEHVTEKSDGK